MRLVSAKFICVSCASNNSSCTISPALPAVVSSEVANPLSSSNEDQFITLLLKDNPNSASDDDQLAATRTIRQNCYPNVEGTQARPGCVLHRSALLFRRLRAP